MYSCSSVATVLELGKKMPGPEKSLNLICGPWKSWNGQKISLSISKNNKNMLLVKIFWYDSAVKQNSRLRKAWFFVQSELSLVVFHFQDQPI